jgi:hypothetical protein
MAASAGLTRLVFELLDHVAAAGQRQARVVARLASDVAQVRPARDSE